MREGESLFFSLPQQTPLLPLAAQGRAGGVGRAWVQKVKKKKERKEEEESRHHSGHMMQRHQWGQVLERGTVKFVILVVWNTSLGLINNHRTTSWVQRQSHKSGSGILVSRQGESFWLQTTEFRRVVSIINHNRAAIFFFFLRNNFRVLLAKEPYNPLCAAPEAPG